MFPVSNISISSSDTRELRSGRSSENAKSFLRQPSGPADWALVALLSGFALLISLIALLLGIQIGSL